MLKLVKFIEIESLFVICSQSRAKLVDSFENILRGIFHEKMINVKRN